MHSKVDNYSVLQKLEETKNAKVLIVLSITSLYLTLGYLTWRENVADPMEAVWMLAVHTDSLRLVEFGLDEDPDGFVSEVSLTIDITAPIY